MIDLLKRPTTCLHYLSLVKQQPRFALRNKGPALNHTADLSSASLFLRITSRRFSIRPLRMSGSSFFVPSHYQSLSLSRPYYSPFTSSHPDFILREPSIHPSISQHSTSTQTSTSHRDGYSLRPFAIPQFYSLNSPAISFHCRSRPLNTEKTRYP